MAAAAYRAGCELIDERTGQVHDYTRKGGVVETCILAPDGGSAERNALWNAAEDAEKRKDARTAREWIIALPSELDAADRSDLARSFGAALAERYGVAVDVAVHLPDREGDNRNHHAHVLTTTRQVSRDDAGRLVFGDKASIELSDKARRAAGLGPGADEVRDVRELWERLANQRLERAGRAERIDARSLKAQGIDREATTHLGPTATDMERRGAASDRGDGNRQALANNAERARLSAQIIDLRAERERREQAAKEAAAKAERERIARMTSKELAAEIERIRPRPVADLAREDGDVRRAKADADRLAGMVDGIDRSAAALDKRERDHAEKGFFGKLASFTEPGRIMREREELQAQRDALMPKWEAATHDHRQATYAATGRIELEQMPTRSRMAELDALRIERAKQEQRDKLQAEARARAEKAAQKVPDTFAALAKARATDPRYGDGKKRWDATPDSLKKLVDVYNRATPAQQAATLEAMRDNPKHNQAIGLLLNERKQVREAQQDRGMGYGR